MSEVMDDPRAIEYRQAHADVSRGLSAPPGAFERYRLSLLPYVTNLAEHIDALLAAGDTHPQMRRIMMRALFNQGLPLGVIAVGFRATEGELEYVSAHPPIREEPVDEIERLRTMPYGGYLRSAHWQAVREAALKRAEHRCQICNSEQQLEVHHREYKRRGCERPADVMVLCSSCHERHHGAMRAA